VYPLELPFFGFCYRGGKEFFARGRGEFREARGLLAIPRDNFREARDNSQTFSRAAEKLAKNH
jgi:hypothetical protein